MALVDQPAEETVLRLQIEDAVLLDPGRDKQQRRPEDRVSAWGVLDQIEQARHELDRLNRQIARLVDADADAKAFNE